MSTRRRFLGAVAAAAALAGCTGESEMPTDTESPTGTDAPGESPTDVGTPSSDATVTVGPGGDLRFDPKTLEVDPGATVAFVWDSDGHTVTVDAQPEGADWTATGQSTEGAGYAHTHTFEVAGRYDYYCEPHRGAGMVGSVLVGDGGDGGTDGATTATTTSGDGYEGPY